MTKKCKDGTVIMEKGYIHFRTKKPDQIAIFRCEDIETFNYITSLKDFVREQIHYGELLHARTDAENYKQLFNVCREL